MTHPLFLEVYHDLRAFPQSNANFILPELIQPIELRRLQLSFDSLNDPLIFAKHKASSVVYNAEGSHIQGTSCTDLQSKEICEQLYDGHILYANATTKLHEAYFHLCVPLSNGVPDVSLVTFNKTIPNLTLEPLREPMCGSETTTLPCRMWQESLTCSRLRALKNWYVTLSSFLPSFEKNNSFKLQQADIAGLQVHPYMRRRLSSSVFTSSFSLFQIAKEKIVCVEMQRHHLCTSSLKGSYSYEGALCCPDHLPPQSCSLRFQPLRHRLRRCQFLETYEDDQKLKEPCIVPDLAEFWHSCDASRAINEFTQRRLDEAHGDNSSIRSNEAIESNIYGVDYWNNNFFLKGLRQLQNNSSRRRLSDTQDNGNISYGHVVSPLPLHTPTCPLLSRMAICNNIIHGITDENSDFCCDKSCEICSNNSPACELAFEQNDIDRVSKCCPSRRLNFDNGGSVKSSTNAFPLIPRCLIDLQSLHSTDVRTLKNSNSKVESPLSGCDLMSLSFGSSACKMASLIAKKNETFKRIRRLQSIEVRQIKHEKSNVSSKAKHSFIRFTCNELNTIFEKNHHIKSKKYLSHVNNGSCIASNPLTEFETYSSAEFLCAEVGARLCSVDELTNMDLLPDFSTHRHLKDQDAVTSRQVEEKWEEIARLEELMSHDVYFEAQRDTLHSVRNEIRNSLNRMESNLKPKRNQQDVQWSNTLCTTDGGLEGRIVVPMSPLSGSGSSKFGEGLWRRDARMKGFCVPIYTVSSKYLGFVHEVNRARTRCCSDDKIKMLGTQFILNKNENKKMRREGQLQSSSVCGLHDSLSWLMEEMDHNIILTNNNSDVADVKESSNGYEELLKQIKIHKIDRITKSRSSNQVISPIFSMPSLNLFFPSQPLSTKSIAILTSSSCSNHDNLTENERVYIIILPSANSFAFRCMKYPFADESNDILLSSSIFTLQGC